MLHTLNEEKTRIEGELTVLNEGKKEVNPWAVCHASTGPKKTKKFEKCVLAVKKKENIEEDERSLEKSKTSGACKSSKGCHAVIDPKKINKKTSKNKLNEGLTEKGVATVQKWIAEKGAREAAVKMVDSVLSRMLGGLTSSDLGDTSIFANGLDEIESLLENNDYNGAFEVARDTAKEMIEDEGGGDLFGEQKLNEGPKVSRDELMSTLKKMFPEAWFKPGEYFDNDESENSIWTGEGSYANNGMELFNYYAEDPEEKTYIMGVYKPLYNFLDSVGYYAEAYDAGTYFIYPV